MSLLRNLMACIPGTRIPEVAMQVPARPTPPIVENPTPPPRLQEVDLSTLFDPPTTQPVQPQPAPVDDADAFIPHLIATDRCVESNRLQEQADTGYINVSSLEGMCPRALLLAEGGGNIRTNLKAVGSNDRVVWEMGRAAEKAVRDRIIASVGVENVIGRWVCPCEATDNTYDTTDDLPEGQAFAMCDCERQQVDTYKELTMYDHEAGIRGNCDLPYLNAAGLLVPAEIKSMKGDDFKALTAPLPDHIFQVSGYYRLYRMAGYRMAGYVRIIYVSKNVVKGLPYKEYVVWIGESQERRLDNAWANAATYRRYRELREVAPRLPVCTNINSSRAKSCELVTSCFSRR